MFFNFMRMSSSNFEDLVSLVGPLIYRHPYRPDILSPREILSATLRYLATGDSMASIMYSFRIGESTVSGLIKECCLALWEVLKDKVIKLAYTMELCFLLQISMLGWKCLKDLIIIGICYMPNCVGAMDGKHIVHQAFSNSGSMYYNYKGTHSIVLLAICDANNEIDFPDDAPIDSDNGFIPYYIVADEAFMLLPNVMRPYPSRSKANLPIDEAAFKYMGSNFYGQTAKVIREKIKNHLMNEGELPFQYDKI
ncbi:putative nuclease HARBI1 [Acyrthosiphon pisum]|uniref:DDE Tnp4 domain-containing protein n=1 Tax=Acyrthosiphon pisum TaxID=7029 RepID=A0A8R2H2Y6_ACYPI|nr:putative nuclease HARBI1 [Acyrthosiphon pisum]|eukprot:XP_016656676.1 PREDICTED: putative nuclease HARBI1 [Acyrthosiphon pisum]